MSAYPGELLGIDKIPSMLPPGPASAEAMVTGAEVIPIRPGVYPDTAERDKALDWSETNFDSSLPIDVKESNLTLAGVSSAVAHLVAERRPEESKPAEKRDLSVTGPLQARSDRLEKWLLAHFKGDWKEVGNIVMNAYGLIDRVQPSVEESAAA